jgi:glutathione synthase
MDPFQISSLSLFCNLKSIGDHFMGASQWHHILFIDSLEKLSLEKDSSLQLAISLQNLGNKVSLVFEEDFFFQNTGKAFFNCYSFSGAFKENSSYIDNFALNSRIGVELGKRCVIHMRIDPPFDSRYTRYLWILKALKEVHGIRVINDPEGILVYNEKMICYEQENAAPSFVGASEVGFSAFHESIKNDEKREYAGMIFKPLDLYQGIGVEKVAADLSDADCLELFKKKKDEFGGAVVVQPFLKEVEQGEIRSIFFNGHELGNIIKVPPKGEFLANIAQGATYESIELDDETKVACLEMSKDLAKKGVPWIAYDILGGVIQEANLTCPGLLVEVSKAAGKNLAIELAHLVEEYLD